MFVGFQTCLTGLVADLIANNRRLVEDTLWRVRRLELETSSDRRDSQPVSSEGTGDPSKHVMASERI